MRPNQSIFVDEHAEFERPSRRSRPRTKDRPDYSGAAVGMVFTVDRGRYRVLIGGHEVTATKARQLGRTGVIVGDDVQVVGDISGEDGTLGRIVAVQDRRTILRRTADDDDPYERPIVANADKLVIVAALADPPPRPGMINRLLVAAFDAGLTPLLCLTKSDLADPAELVELYRPLEIATKICRPGADLTDLRTALRGHRSVFVGHSGVGKSTLVNALIPGAKRAIGAVNAVTGRGRHTSTSAIALRLPAWSGLAEPAPDPTRPTDSSATTDDPGWVIDTPGVRSFGLSHVSHDRILAAFDDLAEAAANCPRGCTHTAADPECALDLAVAAGDLAASRVASFRGMLGSGQ